MTTLLVHVTGGHRLAYDLDDDNAQQIVDTVRAWWWTPDRFPADQPPELAFTDLDGGRAWIPLAQVVAVQALPADGGDQ